MRWARGATPGDPQELALLADLLAAALDAGAPLSTALAVADAAVPGPRRHLLGPVRRRLLAGDVENLTIGEGQDLLPPTFLRALRRSGRSGARLAAQLRLLADDLRAEAAAAALERAHRVGVLAVLPLGLCCLPAFMLLAVVPLAAGLLRNVLG
ncbi:MAG TPA: type II secretion system F family protein [Frankiaceae bacterium]|nr:type II secretion system F family protein [Frankiaceae bacterium]